MRPSARIAALIELTEQIEESIAAGGAPADILVGNYFRARRYAGSKDRRAISEMVYAILRQRELLVWTLDETGAKPTARNLIIAYLALNEPEALLLFAEESGYAPAGLNTEETTLTMRLKDFDVSCAPVETAANLPVWARAGFKERYGGEWSGAAASLNTSAPVDLRLNLLKCKKGTRDRFHNPQLEIENTGFSPIGLRSRKNIALGSIDDYKRGLLEVQDEAAQLASLLVDAKPGMQVIDLCAGAGGKSLTVSGQMANKGQLYAFDVSAKRLNECRKRAQRAGVRNIQVTQLPTSGEQRAERLAMLRGQGDRVYVDVPCSGTGTWRRSPDQRWRQTDESLAELNRLQLSLLREAAELVSAEGRLFYMTCSVLPAENEAIVAGFLDKAPGWRLLDYKKAWAETIGSAAPDTLANMSDTLQLSPETHGTDGFFVTILVRN